MHILRPIASLFGESGSHVLACYVCGLKNQTKGKGDSRKSSHYCVQCYFLMRRRFVNGVAIRALHPSCLESHIAEYELSKAKRRLELTEDLSLHSYRTLSRVR